MSGYVDFLHAKAQLGGSYGFAPTFIPASAFDFQARLIEWSVRMGRAAIYADCGLGKTLMELAWGQNVVERENRPVILFTPLAVAQQTAREAEKFGIPASLALDGKVRPGLNICNYERMHYFDPADFVAAIADESACIKDFDGVRRMAVTEFMRKMKYRLLCTATPAPNEYTELGTSSEALGHLGHMDMLSRFFCNAQGNSIKPHVFRQKGGGRAALDEGAKWRFKGHAEGPFWQWVASWARACRKPSDLGFDDGPYQLPPLVEQQHLVESARAPEGMLFALPAVGLKEQRAERRRTVEDRCEHAAALVRNTGAPAALWCHLNDEGDILADMLPNAVQVSGRDPDEEKEAKFLAFINGQVPQLITKPSIGAWGLNFQHCAHTTMFPSHSFEQYYQSVRRFWRFGQSKPVRVDIITTEGEKNVLENLQRKAKAADAMFAGLVSLMHQAVAIDRSVNFSRQAGIPSWAA